MNEFVSSIDEVDVKNASIAFCLSTPITDRADDIIEFNAISLKSHEKLPYLCFNHYRTSPIGRCENEGKYTLEWKNGGLYGKAFFPQNDFDSMWLFDKVVKGLLNGMSPGFIRKSYKPNPNSKQGGLIYTADAGRPNELIEASICVNGENPEAYILLVEKCLKEETGQKPSDWIQKQFNDIVPIIKKSMTVATTPPPVTPPVNSVKTAVVNKSDTESGKDKPMPAGATALKEIHKWYVAGKALVTTHKALQEKESPVHAHLEEIDKAIDDGIAVNKDLHDERYAKEHGELEDVPSDTNEIAKELTELILIKKTFNQYKAATDKKIRDLTAQIKKAG